MLRFKTVCFLLLAQVPLSASVIYVGLKNGDFGTLDSATGIYNKLGTPGQFGGLAFDTSGRLDGTPNQSNAQLLRVDQSNGSTTVVGSIGLTGLAGFSSTPGGPLYLVDRTNLNTVNPDTAQLTVVRSNGVLHQDFFYQGNGPDGNVYLNSGTSFGTERLYKLSPTTTTDLGPAASFEALVSADNSLYTFKSNGTFEDLYSVNTTSGAQTLVRTTTISAGLGTVYAAASPAPSSTPEPGTLALLIGGGSLIAFRFRKHQA